MAITTAEATSLYNALIDEMKRHGLGWIVAQVEEQIAVGKLATEKLPVTETELYVPGEDLFDVPISRPVKRRASATFVVSRPYTEEEKLLLLVQAMRIGVAEVNSIALDVADFIANELDGATLEFQPETESDEVLIVERESARRAASEGNRLVRLLDELEGEL
ncbi:MAG TPA: hypothetical protein VFJ16_27790 [Longimicrobium sp.]|nr:hypothetical protein [Longimicrobium sp.]